MYQAYQYTNIITTIGIEILRLRWAWHVKRMKKMNVIRRIMGCKQEGVTSIERPK